MLEKVGGQIDLQNLQTDTIPGLIGQNIELIESVEKLFEQPDDLRRMIAYQEVCGLVLRPELTGESIARAAERIEATAVKIETLLTQGG